MSDQLATTNHRADAIERAIVQGDLGKLTPEERVQHYLRVCDSLGLNPHTQPFDYITLQGRLQLYAKRACTDQLRKINGVSVLSVKQQLSEDGVLTVLVEVQDRDGRRDVDEGCVFVKGLKGEALANAYMKAITKGKRRATLSLCGLGWLDESEVDSVPGAHVGPVEPPPALPGPATEDGDDDVIADQQARELDDLLGQVNKSWEKAREWLRGQPAGKDFPEDGQTSDLTFRQAAILRKAVSSGSRYSGQQGQAAQTKG